MNLVIGAREKPIIRKTILLICLAIINLTIFLGINFSHAQQITKEQYLENQCTIMTNEILDTISYRIKKQELKINSTQKIITSFCDALKSTEAACYKDNKQYYNYKESVFTYFLCESAGADISHFNELSGYLKQDHINRLGLVSYEKYAKTCNPDHTVLNDCSIQYYYPRLLEMVLNDYFTMKQIQFFSAQNTTKSTKEKANTFSEKYFDKIKICKNTHYKKTCEFLKEYISDAEKVLNNLAILDGKKIGMSEPNCDFPVLKENFLTCGLAEKNAPSDKHFINTVYNELYWYFLFLDYYQVNIHISPHYFVGTLDQDLNNSLQIKHINEKVATYRRKSDKLFAATRLSIQRIQSMKKSFPLHIGLLMYQEDLINLRKGLGNMYTPLRTLYDKLRNVQDSNT